MKNLQSTGTRRTESQLSEVLFNGCHSNRRIMLQQWRRITVLEKAGQVTFKPCLKGHRQLLKKWEQAMESVLNRKIRFFLIICNVGVGV